MRARLWRRRATLRISGVFTGGVAGIGEVGEVELGDGVEAAVCVCVCLVYTHVCVCVFLFWRWREHFSLEFFELRTSAVANSHNVSVANSHIFCVELFCSLANIVQISSVNEKRPRESAANSR